MIESNPTYHNYSLVVLILVALIIPSAYTLAQENLEVEGAIKVGDTQTAEPAPGTIRFNPATNDFEGWNGLYWISLTGF